MKMAYKDKRKFILENFETMSPQELLTNLIELGFIDNIPSSYETTIIGLHKARLYVSGIDKELVEKSRKWLENHNYSKNIY